VHLIFVFDQIPTSFILYAAFAYVVFKNKENLNFKIINKKIIYVFMFIVVVFLGFAFIKNIGPAYFQMRKYTNLLLKNNLVVLSENINKVFTPFTFAQLEIRKHFTLTVNEALQNVKKGSDQEPYVKELFDLSLEKSNEYVDNRFLDFRFLGHLADSYTIRNGQTNDMEDLKEAEILFRKALEFAPKRQDLNHNLLVNLAYQGRYEEAWSFSDLTMSLDPSAAEANYYRGFLMAIQGTSDFDNILKNLEIGFNKKPELFVRNHKANVEIYVMLLERFFVLKNKENFLIVSKRLKNNNYPGSSLIDEILSYVEKDIWPKVDFVR
jgi:tetratricopeptide (TPR) repeat protein